MTRYTKQFDQYSCGPAALVNALKWAGHKISWKKEKQKWVQRCGTTIKDGTSVIGFDVELSNHFDFEDLCQPSISDIEKALEAEDILVANIAWPRWSKSYGYNHYFLIVGMSQGRKFFDVVNMFPTGKAKRRISRKTLLKYISSRHRFFIQILSKDRIKS